MEMVQNSASWADLEGMSKLLGQVALTLSTSSNVALPLNNTPTAAWGISHDQLSEEGKKLKSGFQMDF